MFESFVRRVFHYFGVYFRRYKSPVHFYNSIKHAHPSVQYHELKTLVNGVRSANDIQYYEEVLGYMIPDYVTDNSGVFFGNGSGKGNLNVYRILTHGNTKIFEKIYDTNAIALKKNLWFYNKNINKLITNYSTYKVPNIVRLNKSTVLTVINFEFIKNNGLIAHSKSLIDITLELYKLSLKDSFKALITTAPDYVTDYLLDEHIKQNLNLVEQTLEKHNLNKITIEKTIDLSDKVLTHEDLKVENIINSNIILDWDYFGLYPIGHDIALVYYKIFLQEKFKLSHPIKWLKKNYSEVIVETTIENLKYNFSYFLLFFAAQDEAFLYKYEDDLIYNIKANYQN